MEVSNVFRPVFIPTPKPTASIRYPKRKRNSSPSISGYYTTEPLRQLIYLQKNLLTNLLKLPFLELYADYYSTVKEHKVTTLHKEEIGYFFLDLLLKHYKENKEVAFYAEKVCIVSSKYLTEALTLVSGKSPQRMDYTLYPARDLRTIGESIHQHTGNRSKNPVCQSCHLKTFLQAAYRNIPVAIPKTGLIQK